MGGLSEEIENPARWLYVTLFLGLLFVAGQYIAWRNCSAEGLYLATNPSSSFFLCTDCNPCSARAWRLRRADRCDQQVDQRPRCGADHAWLRPLVTGILWDVLWVYLLLLLWMKL